MSHWNTPAFPIVFPENHRLFGGLCWIDMAALVLGAGGDLPANEAYDRAYAYWDEREGRRIKETEEAALAAAAAETEQ
jgi:hypothetical protein